MIRFIFNTNLFIAFCATVLTIGTSIFYGEFQYLKPYLVLVFFATLFDYNLHRIVKLKFNIGSNDKLKWSNQNTHVHYVTSIFSLVGITISLPFIAQEIIFILIPLAVLTAFYTIPFSRIVGINFLCVRKIAGMKNVLIAIVWTMVTCFIPSIRLKFDSQMIFLLLERFLFILAISIPFDVKDVDEDRKAGIKTFPVIYGEKKALLFSTILLLFFLAISFIHFIVLSKFNLLISSALTVIFALFIINSPSLKKQKHYHPFFVDGLILFQGILLILVSL